MSLAIIAVALLAGIGLSSPAPAAAALAWSNPVLLASSGLTGVACPTASQCTAVGADGQEVTFDPAAPQNASTAIVGNSGRLMEAVACPTSTQCTAIDEVGYETSFNPQSPTSATQVRIDPYESLMGIACPTASRCTAVGGQYEMTFDPTSTTVPAEITVDPGSLTEDGVGGMMWIACPTTAQCTAVDYLGREVTFNPSSPGTPSPITVDPGDYSYYPALDTPPNALEGVSCPTETQCTAVDASGGEVAFDPTAPVSPAPAPSVPLPDSPLFAVACPTSTGCVAVGHNDRWTFAIEGAPHASPPWFVEPLPDASGPTAVACPTAAVCVVVDNGGHEITGTSAANPPASVNDALPDFDDPAADLSGGTVEPGQTLTGNPGTWFNAPSTFAYQWDDCDNTGANCVPIPGATGPTYTLTPADVGHMIRFDVIASNAGGSTPASSYPWALVQAADDSSAGPGGPGSDSGAPGGTAEPAGAGTDAPAPGARLTVGRIRVHGSAAAVAVRCAGDPGAACAVRIALTVPVTSRRVARAGAARFHGRRGGTNGAIAVGRVTTIISAGRNRVLRVPLNAFARSLLALHAGLRVRLTVAAGSTTTTLRPLSTRTLTFTRTRG